MRLLAPLFARPTALIEAPSTAVALLLARLRWQVRVQGARATPHLCELQGDPHVTLLSAALQAQ